MKQEFGGNKMANEWKDVELELSKIVLSKKERFIIFPYGEIGHKVKGWLNNKYHIREELILDNNVSQDGCETVQCLQSHSIDDDVYVLFCSAHRELKKCLLEYVGEDKVIDLVNPDYYQKICYKLCRCKENTYNNNIMIKKSKFCLPLRDKDLIQSNIFLNEKYFEENQLLYYTNIFGDGVIGTLMNNGGAVLDIGANIGNHTLYFANECNAKRIYAFEPVKETFQMLSDNIKLNHLEEKVELINKGVGDKVTHASITRFVDDNIGATSLEFDEEGRIEIISIDSMKIDEPVVLMKIDVEGLEMSVIKGALSLIKRDMPYIVCESWGNNVLNIIEFLDSNGYSYEQISVCDYIFYPKQN
jgi:FkbM family methyltransferase